MTDYFGKALDADSCEVLTIQYIDAKLLKQEAALYVCKWFDYRPLSPAQATYLMVHHYNRAYGDYIGKAIDHKKRFVKAIKGRDFFPHKECKSFWRLRQLIDSLGMRYEFFLRAAMNWHLSKGWGKGCMKPPRPSHLLNDHEMIMEVSNAWVRECRSCIQHAQHPTYRTENWAATPAQLAYQDYLIAQIKAKPHRRYALHAALYVFGTLRIEAALQHFEEHEIADAIAHCLDMDKSPVTTIPADRPIMG